MKKDKLSCVACVVFLLGCSHHASEDPELRDIRFQGNIQDLQTVVVGRAEANFANEKKVQLFIVEREGVNASAGVPLPEHFNQMITGVDGVLRFTDGEKHVYPENPIDVYGYHCEGMEGSPADHLALPVVIVADQTTDGAVGRSDFLYVKSTRGYVAGEAPIHLAFEHQFSKIQFNVNTHTPATVHLDELNEIRVLNVVTEGTFNVATGDLSEGRTIDDVVAKIPSTASDGTSVIILPQTIRAKENLFRFTVGTEEFVCPISSKEMVFEQGKLYKCDIWLDVYPGTSETKIELSSSISDWDELDLPINIVVGKGEEAIVTLDDVVAGVMINRADLYLFSGDTPFTIMDVPVGNNEMKFIFPRLEVDGKLQLKKIHFYTSNNEEFDYYFTNKELRGDDFDRLSLTPPKEYDAWGDGVIFLTGKVTGFDTKTNKFVTDETYVNAYHGRILSNKSLKLLGWADSKSVGYNTYIGLSDENDGKKNMENMEKFIIMQGEKLNQYPAFYACQNLGEEWYLPAINEICVIASKYVALNVTLGKLGGDLLDTSIVIYSSSTEKTDGIGYLGCDRTGNKASNDTKMTTGKVRAVSVY